MTFMLLLGYTTKTVLHFVVCLNTRLPTFVFRYDWPLFCVGRPTWCILVDIKKLLTYAIKTTVIARGLIFTLDSYAKRVLPIVETSVRRSVCLSVCHTVVLCQNDSN